MILVVTNRNSISVQAGFK